MSIVKLLGFETLGCGVVGWRTDITIGNALGHAFLARPALLAGGSGYVHFFVREFAQFFELV